MFLGRLDYGKIDARGYVFEQRILPWLSKSRDKLRFQVKFYLVILKDSACVLQLSIIRKRVVYCKQDNDFEIIIDIIQVHLR